MEHRGPNTNLRRGTGARVLLVALFFSLGLGQQRSNAQISPDVTLPTATIEPIPTPFPAPDISSAFTISQTYGLTGRLAFSANVGGRDLLFLLDLDARRVRNLVYDYGNNTYPSWSPGGERFAFVSDRDGNREIYLASWDGTQLERLTDDPAVDDHPAFSADGKQLVFISGTATEGEAKKTNLYALSLASRARTQLTNLPGRNSTPRWSPDGRYLSYTTDRFWPGWDVCLWDLTLKSERCILQGRETYCRAEWNHTGKQLVYSFGLLKQIQLGIYEYPTGEQSVLTQSEGRDYDAAWSADDQWVIFTGERETAGVFNLYAVNLKDRKTLPLLSSPYTIRYLSWSPVKTLTLEARRIMEQDRLRDQQSDNAPSNSPATPPSAPPAASPSTPAPTAAAGEELVPF